MSREEEKSKAATTIAAWIIGNGISFQKVKEACVMRGIEWADQHPREGLWDAEKVVKWILENADKHIWYDEMENECGITDNFIEDLKKAIKEK